MSDKLLTLLQTLPIMYCADKNTAHGLLQNGVLACVPTIVRTEQFNPAFFHLCFDWESTLVSDESDKIILANGAKAFSEYEWDNRNIPHQPGPLYPLLLKIKDYSKIKISIFTARDGEESARVLTTLESWGVPFNSVYSMLNRTKGEMANLLQSDILFDDSLDNINDTLKHGCNTGWIPLNLDRT